MIAIALATSAPAAPHGTAAAMYGWAMPQILGGVDPAGLERSCESIRLGACAPGLERADVQLRRSAFAPHRHDTYAVGITTAGVQRFRYRGERRICLAGQLHVLHPDELHDGGAATDDGFAYRILYVAPELIRAALDGGALPFVPEPVHDLTPASRPLAEALAELDEPLGELAAELERIAGADRFSIAREFRRAYGTSPDRYRTLRRLALARAAIDAGEPLARAAADAGFADQSHLTRQFKRAYGLTPARWAALTAAGTTRTPRRR
jgi:AraC-like DNA-binding protein